IRNICICAHIDHGKTTFSDNLLSGAGMLSEDLAGKACALDFHEDEKERGITIDSASVSMVHDLEGEEFLVNLIDTPGHVDFGGDVTRAMRAVDGAVTLCCAVEGVMPQTETVLRQALRERVKPVLFINKVDRLIREVKLTPEAMSQRFVEIINHVNNLIEQIAPEEYKQKWKVSVQDGSVAFGSAFQNWALSFPYMKRSGLTFKDVFDYLNSEDPLKIKELAKRAPLHKVVLDMSVHHHPNPKQAQAYRVPKLWHGDLESPIGKSLLGCDQNGPFVFVTTKIVMDKHAGEVAAGRLFSGVARQGAEVYMNLAKKSVRLQQVSVYKGAQRIQVDEVPAGNIIGLVGLHGVFSGETVSEGEMEPFEAIKHIFEPVVTKSIEPKNPADLPKLIEVLKQVAKEDPTIKIEINEETGENLISGMGELHLEIKENRMKTERGLDVKTSPPIVVYRESVTKRSAEFEGKTPNKHNRLMFTVEPMPDNIFEALKSGELPEVRVRKKDIPIFDKLIELGVAHKESRNYQEFYKGNALVDDTRGIVQIGEIIGLVMDGFEQVMDVGGLAGEPCTKMLVRLVDCKLHEDAIHRGPSQMYPAVREGIRECIMNARPSLLEPVQEVQIECPSDFMGEISKLVQNKRGQLLSMDQQGAHLVVKAVMPVAEMFGLTSELRSATSGRGSFFVVNQKFDKLPESLQQKVIGSIRQRKGMPALS
ncbi:elongation factor EF-2, partial [Candidatus Woesearchaeota archaeon]|nr:elongation factor EF-2 [Candidatus Woesearchaeota archaeon]